jgi:hypothetical protein
MFPIPQRKFSSQLEKVFNFVNASLELRDILACTGKDVIYIHVLGTQQLVPQISSFVWVKQSPNPFSH